MRSVRCKMAPRGRSLVVLSFLGLLLSSCTAETRRLGHFVRSVQSAIEIVAMTCGGVFALVFIGGATGALLKNLRAPSVRSKRWGVALGALNLAFGSLLVLGVATSPPRDPVARVQTATEVVEMVDVSGIRIETEIETTSPPAALQQRGSINWVDLGVLSVLALVHAVFGLAGVLVARRATPVIPAA